MESDAIPQPAQPTMNLLVNERTGRSSDSLRHLPIPTAENRVHDGRFIMSDGRSQTYLLTERLGQFRTHCPCGWRSEWADEPPYSALDEHQAQPLGSDDSKGA